MSSLLTWKVLEPDAYYRNFIEKNKRADGRGWLKGRHVTLKKGSIGSAEGSATVRVGNTSVVCGIRAEIAVPNIRNPKQGFVIPNVELHPCCSANIKTDLPGEKAMVASRFLSSVFGNSNLIDLENLCIIPNKYVWCLYCDVVCVDLDGNLCDAALLAFIAALQDLRLPQVTISDNENITFQHTLDNSLALNTCPVATTFALYSSEIQLLDPTAEDENECQGSLTFVLDASGAVITTKKTGGHTLAPQSMQTMMQVAVRRTKSLCKSLQQESQDMET